MKKLIIILLVAGAFAAGCDPMRRINMTNATKEKAEVTWFIKEDSLASSPFYINSSKEVKFVMEPEAGMDKIKMSFGIGPWSSPVLTNLADDLDSVVISWSQKTVVLTSEEDIKNYLFARRRGLDKSKIYILLKEEQL